MLDLSPTISIVTLSINGLNIPIKDRLAEWIGTHDSSISNNDTGRLKVKGGETHILKNYWKEHGYINIRLSGQDKENYHKQRGT